jgi:hypothetical protein
VWVVLEESFHRRVEALGADAGTLLLIAAAEPIGDPTSALEGGGSGRRPAPCRRRAAGSRAAARRRHGRVPSSAGPVRDVPVGIPERATCAVRRGRSRRVWTGGGGVQAHRRQPADR